MVRYELVLRFSGTNAGSLYGRGVYFGEASIKSDEYGKDEDSLTPMLVCRVILGKVLYDDTIYPNPDELVGKVTSGQFDSILGDREKCRGTYREFITFDTDFIYPEFIVWYQRIY